MDEVERRTGLDFFSALPDDEEARLEGECDVNEWNEGKAKQRKLK